MKNIDVIEIEIECSDEQLPAVMAKAVEVIAQSEMAAVVRQVFYELPESAQITMQLPNMAIQKIPFLENKNGEVQRPRIEGS